MFTMHEVVRTRRDIPELSVKQGMTGTVVATFVQPSKAYEVEFVDEAGATTLLTTLSEEDIEPLDVGASG